MSNPGPPPAYGQNQAAGYPPPAGFQGQPQQAGYPPGYGQPPPAAYNQQSTVVVQQQPVGGVIITGGCAACGGHISENFTACGVILAICFFPLGVLCCFLMMEKSCDRCGVRY